MIRAAVDLGSARVGLVITADVGPGRVRLLGWPIALPVGRRVYYSAPRVKTSKSGHVTTHAWERVYTDDDRRRIVSQIEAIVITAGCAAVALEGFDRIHPGATVGATTAMANNAIVGDVIGGVVADRLERVSIDVTRIKARTWRDGLRRYARAQGDPLAEIKGVGSALDGLLVAHVEGWPVELVASMGDDGAADMRDAGGLAVYGALMRAGMIPEPASKARSPTPREPRERRPRKPRGGRSPPKTIAEIEARDPARAAEVRRIGAAKQVRRRARVQIAINATKRTRGCTCPVGKTGRHPRDCPAFVSKADKSTGGVTSREKNP